MQPRPGFRPLVFGQGQPVRRAPRVLPGRRPASTGCHAMQDRPVERRVDDFVVRHDPLLFNTPNLTVGDRHGYGAKREIVQ